MTNHTNPNLPNEGFIRLPKVLEIIPVSRSEWYAGIASGKYPAPTKLGPNMSAWNVKDIRKLINKFESTAILLLFILFLFI